MAVHILLGIYDLPKRFVNVCFSYHQKENCRVLQTTVKDKKMMKTS